MKVIVSSIFYVFLFWGLAFLIMGCAVIKVETPEWSVSGMSFCKTIDIPRIKKGDMIIEGYKGSVEGEMLGEIIGAAIKAAK